MRAALLTALLALALLLPLRAMADDGGVPYTTAKTFRQDVLRAKAPVLLQFDAHWCPYCRALQPALKALHAAGASGMKVFKVNIDDEGALAGEYAVKTLPTLVVIYRGEEYTRLPGGMDKDTLFEWVEAVAEDIRSAPQDD